MDYTRKSWKLVLSICLCLFILPTSTIAGELSVLEPNLEWKRAINPRFGFTFSYPASWELIEPDNGDGYRVNSPEDDRVILYGYGSWYMFEGEKYDIKQALFLEEDPISLESIEIDEETAKGTEKIPAQKIQWEAEGITHFAIGTEREGRTVMIRCQAPNNNIDNYKAFCEKVLSSLKVLGEFGVAE